MFAQAESKNVPPADPNIENLASGAGKFIDESRQEAMQPALARHDALNEGAITFPGFKVGMWNG